MHLFTFVTVKHKLGTFYVLPRMTLLLIMHLPISAENYQLKAPCGETNLFGGLFFFRLM